MKPKPTIPHFIQVSNVDINKNIAIYSKIDG